MPVVDRSFLKDLKNLDKRLSTKFNGEHIIICFDRGHGEPVNILRVRGEDGGFRQPDRRDLAIIKRGDLGEGEKPELRLKKLAYMSEKMREEARRKSREEIRAMTREDRRYLAQHMGQITNQGKCNSTFRRIKVKPSKNTVRVIP
jgi:hypothetical protein